MRCKFSVQDIICKQISLRVTPEATRDYAKPGEKIVVSVQTMPRSFVGFQAIDEGLMLMDRRSSIQNLHVSRTIYS